MKRTRCIYVILLLTLAASGHSARAVTQDGGGAASYLRLGVGARAQAMGGAYSAVADDPQAAFWNPAGLTQYKGINVYSQVAFLAYERKHSFFSYSHAVKRDVSLALSWLSFSGGDDLERRLGPSLEPLSYFSDRENCYIFSAGHLFHPEVRLGVNSKVLTHRLGESFGWGFGFDLGAIWTHAGYSAALVLRDLGGRINWRNAYQENLPISLRVGGAGRVLPRLLLSAELSKVAEQGVRPHIGGEFSLARELALQLGFDRDVLCGGATVRVFTDWADYYFGYVIGGERMVGASLNHRIEFRMKFNAFDYYLWK